MEVRETDTKDEFSQVCQTLSLSLSCLCFSSVVFYNDTTESIPIIHRRSHQATLTRRCLFPPCQTWTGIQSLFCSPNPRCLIGASVPSRPRGTVTFTSFFLLFLFVFFFCLDETLSSAHPGASHLQRPRLADERPLRHGQIAVFVEKKSVRRSCL